MLIFSKFMRNWKKMRISRQKKGNSRERIPKRVDGSDKIKKSKAKKGGFDYAGNAQQDRPGYLRVWQGRRGHPEHTWCVRGAGAGRAARAGRRVTIRQPFKRAWGRRAAAPCFFTCTHGRAACRKFRDRRKAPIRGVKRNWRFSCGREINEEGEEKGRYSPSHVEGGESRRCCKGSVSSTFTALL